MTGSASRDAGIPVQGSLLSSIHQAGKIADGSPGKIPDVADVIGDSLLALEDFEVLALEGFHDVCALSEHGSHQSGFEWGGKEQENDKAVDGYKTSPAFTVWGEASDLEDVPEHGEEEGPDKVAGTLDLLAAEGSEKEQDGEDGVGEQCRNERSACAKHQDDGQNPEEEHSGAEGECAGKHGAGYVQRAKPAWDTG